MYPGGGVVILTFTALVSDLIPLQFTNRGLVALTNCKCAERGMIHLNLLSHPQIETQVKLVVIVVAD